MKINIDPDKQKARSLKDMADITLKRLKETNIEKYPTNTLADYYSIIRKLMEALTSTEGIKFKGEGAHKELIDYICKKRVEVDKGNNPLNSNHRSTNSFLLFI